MLERDMTLAAPDGDSPKRQTLGRVQLRHRDTKALILVPGPTSDPNDPLNWPQWHKYYIATVLCVAMAIYNFLAAGPSIAMVQTAVDFFPDAVPSGTLVTSAIPKVAYFFTATSLMQGAGNLVWVPVANKWGRRPVYIVSYLLYSGASLWLIFETSYARFLAARILMGFGAGAAETVAPISIADLFFLHQRGAVMSAYTCSLAVGVAAGLIISGLVTMDYHWRAIYQVGAALVGLVLLLVILTFPETAYPRHQPLRRAASCSSANELQHHAPSASRCDADTTAKSRPGRQSYVRSLSVFRARLTDESLLKMMIRPFGLIMLPPVLWATLVQAVTIGFLVAVTSSVDPAFEQAYHFRPYQVGLCFVSAMLGSFLGLPAGGQLGDGIADRLTRRNGGVREPEMRLPAIAVSAITSPLALVLFGVGIQHQLHWICPTIGLGLLNFSITQATSICLAYAIDAYRPVAGEVTLAVMGFKSLFGFLLSFETNAWIDRRGYQNAYGAMAGISAAVLIMWMPLFYWGKRIRHSTWTWPVVSFVHWDDDREVGE